ncbi:hypothetical protein VTH06DRAFT_8795 [Thermothelomyces fergusii]
MPVPTTREVVPGALVNIVLKADQRTGRTVQGAVAQLLTRGNHPRGIKVRLADGRVGRVQSMARDAAVAGPLAQPGGEPETMAGSAPAGFPHGRRGGRRHDADVRQEPPPPSAQPVGLDAYIKPPKDAATGEGRRMAQAARARSTLPCNNLLIRPWAGQTSRHARSAATFEAMRRLSRTMCRLTSTTKRRPE